MSERVRESKVDLLNRIHKLEQERDYAVRDADTLRRQYADACARLSGARGEALYWQERYDEEAYKSRLLRYRLARHSRLCAVWRRVWPWLMGKEVVR